MESITGALVEKSSCVFYELTLTAESARVLRHTQLFAEIVCHALEQ